MGARESLIASLSPYMGGDRGWADNKDIFAFCKVDFVDYLCHGSGWARPETFRSYILQESPSVISEAPHTSILGLDGILKITVIKELDGINGFLYFPFAYEYLEIAEKEQGTDTSVLLSRPKLAYFLSYGKAGYGHQPASFHWVNTYDKRIVILDYPGVTSRKPGDRAIDKLREMQKFRFSIAYENACLDGYYTEKLHDCVRSRVVPIFIGGALPRYLEPAVERWDGEDQGRLRQILNMEDALYVKRLDYAASIRPYLINDHSFSSLRFMIDHQCSRCDPHPLANPLLSICIPTLIGRKSLFVCLVKELMRQVERCDALDEVEILKDIDGGEIPTGTKRNRLVDRARGKYVCFIDDDDEVSEDYIRLILAAIKENPGVDCIGIKGILNFVDGQGKKQRESVVFKCSVEYKEYGEEAIKTRPPLHLTPTKTVLARKARYGDVYIGEEEAYWKKIIEVVKTGFFIDKELYIYNLRRSLPAKCNAGLD